MFSECGVSVWENEKALEVDVVEGYTRLNVFNVTILYT